MRNLFLAFSLLSLASCSTTSQVQSRNVSLTPLESPVINSAKTLTPSNVSLIDALVAAPELVTYGEDGARDATVLALYQQNVGEVIPPKKEVRNIVALKDKPIPLLIECLDDTRPTSAKFIGGYSGSEISEKPFPKVPVGHVCLDILTHIAKNQDANDKDCPRGEIELGACIKDGFYFRPDDYTPFGDGFQERAIVRIVKANWLKSYQNGKVKYDYVVTWK